ncbi:MAG: glycosyltransferase, partial [Candidatus Paceibacteria bacterium]
MKIVFTGGGTGGHFYPIIAVVEELQKLVKERAIIEPELFFFAPAPYDERALFEHGIRFVETPAGKMRRYFSLLNIIDLFKTFFSIFHTTLRLYRVYPDVVFSKGGFGSVPTVLAARLLNIPLIVHDSDAVPGRATLMAAPFARAIGISYDEALQRFPKKFRDKVALTGNPVRKEVQTPAREGAYDFLGLEKNVPVVLILGGSSGSEQLNDTVLSALPKLVASYQVIHQTGDGNIEGAKETARIILDRNERRFRYKPFGFLSPLALKMAAGAGGPGLATAAAVGAGLAVVLTYDYSGSTPIEGGSHFEERDWHIA